MCINTFDLDGITRRNAKRAQDAADTSMYTFDIHLQESMNHLSSSLGMPPLFEQFRMSMHYTEEAIGVDYLFRQTGSPFPTDINTAVDEGFDDNVVVATAQEATGVLPVEDTNVRIKQNNVFIKAEAVTNVTEVTIVWGIRLWFRVNSFRGNACHMACVRHEERREGGG